MTDDKDSVVPGNKWEFDASVAACFDDMLSRSIPSYKMMRQTTYALGTNIIGNMTAPKVVDLGASRGEAIWEFAARYPRGDFYALEISDPMLDVMRNRFQGQTNLHVWREDLRVCNVLREIKNTTVVLSILTLQFIPIEYRQALVQTVFDNLDKGGAFILVEKVLGNTPSINSKFVEEYYEFKRSNGYSYEDIERKKASLEGVLVPITAKWNEDMLYSVGFRQIDCFYRHLNFAGWIAIK